MSLFSFMLITAVCVLFLMRFEVYFMKLSSFRGKLNFSPHMRESKKVQDSGFHAVDSGFQLLDSRSFSVKRPTAVFRNPSPGFRIPHAKIFRIPFHRAKFLGHAHDVVKCDSCLTTINDTLKSSADFLSVINSKREILYRNALKKL